jgi:hypothetical protein
MNLKVFMRSSIFWDNIPCSPLKVNRRFGGACRLRPYGRKVCRETLRLPHDFTLVSTTPKMEVKNSSKTSVKFQRTTWQYSQEIELFITTAVRT